MRRRFLSFLLIAVAAANSGRQGRTTSSSADSRHFLCPFELAMIHNYFLAGFGEATVLAYDQRLLRRGLVGVTNSANSHDASPVYTSHTSTATQHPPDANCPQPSASGAAELIGC